MEESNTHTLYIPVNTPDYDAIISGVGSFEMAIFGVSAVVIIIVGLMVARFSNTLVAVWIAGLLACVVVLTIRRDNCNENLLKKIFIFRKYIKSQKKYIYQYHNIYEVPIKNEEY